MELLNKTISGLATRDGLMPSGVESRPLSCRIAARENRVKFFIKDNIRGFRLL